MHQVFRAFIVVLALLVPAAVSFAQSPRGGIAGTVTIGQHVSILDDQGGTVDGRVDRISTDAIRVSRRGVIADVPLDRIVRIVRPDGVRNGMLVGLGVGAVLGTIGGFSDRQGRGRRASFVPVSMIGNGLICMGLGAAIDAIHKGDRTIYQKTGAPTVSLAPALGRGSRGLALSLGW